MILETNLNENNNNKNINNNNINEKEKKSGILTSRHFSSSSNRIEEENILKNILISPSSGSIGYMDIKSDNLVKNKNAVIPMRKGGVKKINRNRDNIHNIPLTSRCLLNSSNTRNKKYTIDKNHFNLGGGILGNSNSIINKIGVCQNEVNNNDNNTISSVKSIRHIFKIKKNSNPYNKPSYNFIITNIK